MEWHIRREPYSSGYWYCTVLRYYTTYYEWLEYDVPVKWVPIKRKLALNGRNAEFRPDALLTQKII